MSKENFEVGTIKSIGEVKQITDSFKKCEFVLVTDGKYPQTLLFQSTQDNAENVSKYNKVGDKVKVNFNARGREWTNPQGEVKIFNSLDAWRIEKIENVTAKIEKDDFDDIFDN